MSERGQILRFLKKYFQSEVFEKDGFIFEFIQVEIEENFMDAYKFLVNVVLPNPKQSYIVSVFDEMVKDIFKGAYDFHILLQLPLMVKNFFVIHICS